MRSQRDHLNEIVTDLKAYIDQFCQAREDTISDPSGEKCNDAYLLLRDALSGLGEDSM